MHILQMPFITCFKRPKNVGPKRFIISLVSGVDEICWGVKEWGGGRGVFGPGDCLGGAGWGVDAAVPGGGPCRAEENLQAGGSPVKRLGSGEFGADRQEWRTGEGGGSMAAFARGRSFDVDRAGAGLREGGRRESGRTVAAVASTPRERLR